MMAVHPSHQFPPPTAGRWRCSLCDCSPLSPEASLVCQPVLMPEDDPRAGLPCDVERDA